MAAVTQVLHDLDFCDAEIHEILASFDDQNTWGEVSQYTRHLIAALQERQWIAADAGEGVLEVHIGTAAGVPLAGVIATILLSCVTRWIHRRLQCLGLAQTYATQGVSEFFNIAPIDAESIQLNNFGIGLLFC